MEGRPEDFTTCTLFPRGRIVISLTVHNSFVYVHVHVHVYTHNTCTLCEHVYVITCLQLSLAKNKGDFLGVMVMESGYGSALPTPVIAHLSKTGSAARSGQLNIGDHIISVNGINMVGMPVKVCIEQLKVSVSCTCTCMCARVFTVVYRMYMYILFTLHTSV